MRDQIKESDWKLLSQLKPVVLDRFCKQVLDEITATAAVEEHGAHGRYLGVYKLIRERDDELAHAFNDLRRSTAIWRLGSMRALGVVTDEEFERFSEETQNAVHGMLELKSG